MQLTVSSTVGKNSTLSVNDSVFGAKPNAALIAQAIRVYLANQRQGTSKTKTRSEVNRTKKKWFKQKGTGNARHGARTPSLFVGGGVAHGPTGHENWTLKMSTSMRRSALVSVLSAQVKNTVVCDDLAQLDGKTASADKMLLKMLPEAKHVLIVLPKNMSMVLRSLRNIERVYVTSADRLNTYEVAYADAIVLTKESVKMLEDRLMKEAKSEKVAKSKAASAEKTAVKMEKTEVKKAEKSVPKVAAKKESTKEKVAKTKKSK
jgi:large subunit ribosomal protein L4